MSTFLAYFWNPVALHEEAGRMAFECLSSASASVDEIIAAFAVLLRSDDTCARCLAFDHFFHAGTTDSMFHENPYEQFGQELLALARRELRLPAVAGELPSAQVLRAANHASSLQVLWRLSSDSDEEDLANIAEFLGSDEEPIVQRTACQAVHGILSGSARQYPLILDRLCAIAFAPGLNEDVRWFAVTALGDWYALGTVEILMRIAESDDRTVAAHAAHALLYREEGRYGDFVRSLLAGWDPDDSDVWMVRIRNFLGVDHEY